MDKDLKLKISRQEELVPHEQLQNCDCVIVGVGAVGRQVALQLTSMGVKALSVWDHDEVAMENLFPQGYRPDQLKTNKSEATIKDCHNLNPDVQLTGNSRRFARSDYKELTGKHVFFCVDSIDTRKNLYESAIKANSKWLGDSRVAGEIIRVIAEDNPIEGSKYKDTLFAQNEAYVGSCTSKMTIYSANISAGILVGKFAQHIRGQMVGFSDHQFNLLGFDLFES